MCLLCGTELIFKHNKVWACSKFNQIWFFSLQIMPLKYQPEIKTPRKVFQATAVAILTFFFLFTFLFVL